MVQALRGALPGFRWRGRWAVGAVLVSLLAGCDLGASPGLLKEDGGTKHVDSGSGGGSGSGGAISGGAAGNGGAGGNGNGGGAGGGKAEAGTAGATGGDGGNGGSGGATPDSGPDASVDGGPGIDGGNDAGSGDGTAIGVAGQSCSPNGSYACLGHAQRGALACSGGTWTLLPPCPGANSYCDTAPGLSAGSCQPVVAECVGLAPGKTFCRGLERFECGPDLVTARSLETCPFLCSSGQCGGECSPGTKDCGGGGTAGGGLVPRTCQPGGTWLDGTACPYLCATATGACVAATCGDGVKNGNETDKDCGGSCGATCAVTQQCGVNGDCALPLSGKCTSGKCAAAACTDGVKNGNETDKDCGGTCGATCALTQVCTANGDCVLPASGKCTSGKCAAAACTDSVKNGSETDTDCGGTCGATCAVTKKCGGNGDCASGSCVAGVCTTCKPSLSQCSGTGIETCAADGSSWGTVVPCTVKNGTPSCAGATCGIASCASGYANCDTNLGDCEVNLNAPATCGTACNNVKACSVANGTPSCSGGVCGVASCNTGFCNKDGVLTNGCEATLGSAAACGASCTVAVTCQAPTTTCSVGSCACPAGGLTVCGTQCVDMQSDPQNCGGCGLTCSTSCNAGHCTVTLVSGVSAPSSITVDATNVYFGADSNSNIEKVAIGGGTVSTLCASDHVPSYGMQVVGSTVYWTTNSGTIQTVSTAGGTASTLASGRGDAEYMARDVANLYWSEPCGTTCGKVMKYPLAGGPAQTLASGQNGTEGVAVDATNVYFANIGDLPANGSVVRVNLSGGTPTTLAANVGQPVAVAVDSQSVFFATLDANQGLNGSIMQVSAAGGATAKAIATGTTYAGGTIAVDAASVYWANFGDGTVVKVAKSGGSVTTLASGLTNPLSVAIDANSVYFTTTNSVGKVTPK